MTDLCECGCGKMVNTGKRFVRGHSSVGAFRSPEMRKKVSEALMGHIHYPQWVVDKEKRERKAYYESQNHQSNTV